MIAMIIKKTVNGNVYEFMDAPNIWYIGRILSDEQIKNLKKFNNTVISYKMLNQLGKKRIIAEIEALTGIRCIIKIHDHDDGKSVIVWKKPEYEIDATSDPDNYILNIVNYGEAPEFVKSYTRLVRNRDFKVIKYYTLEDVKEMLKADGYTAVKFK